jgi:hypothetical protein
MRPAQPAMPTRIAPLPGRLGRTAGAGTGAGRGAGLAAATAADFSGLAFCFNGLAGGVLTGRLLPARFGACGAAPRRDDLLAMQPPQPVIGI